MSDEFRESKSIKMRSSIVRKAHLEAIEQGKTLGRWIEEAILREEAGERGKGKTAEIEKDLLVQVFQKKEG